MLLFTMLPLKVLVFISWYGISSCMGFSQATHKNLTQAAQVACWKRDNTYHMQFFLEKNLDRIDFVYTMDSENRSDVSIGVFDSDGNGISGQGTTQSPFTFHIVATGNLPSNPITCSPDDVQNKKATVIGSDMLKVMIMSKSRYTLPMFRHISFADDVIYEAVCNFSLVSDYVVDTVVQVDGSVTEGPEVIVDNGILEVLADGQSVNSVVMGKEIQLSASAVQPTTATGVYVHSCYACDTIDCSNIFIEFIDQDGCNLFEFISPFLSRGPGPSATTSSFNIFSFDNNNGNGNYVVFRCMMNFCYNFYDPKCFNYCEYNTIKRKKRQVTQAGQNFEDQEVWTILVLDTRVDDSDDGDDDGDDGTEADELKDFEQAAAVEAEGNKDILIACLSLGAVLVVAVIVSSLVLFRVTSKKRLRARTPHPHT